jgi:hypothetical protein
MNIDLHTCTQTYEEEPNLPAANYPFSDKLVKFLPRFQYKFTNVVPKKICVHVHTQTCKHIHKYTRTHTDSNHTHTYARCKYIDVPYISDLEVWQNSIIRCAPGCWLTPLRRILVSLSHHPKISPIRRLTLLPRK